MGQWGGDEEIGWRGDDVGQKPQGDAFWGKSSCFFFFKKKIVNI